MHLCFFPPVKDIASLVYVHVAVFDPVSRISRIIRITTKLMRCHVIRRTLNYSQCRVCACIYIYIISVCDVMLL